MSRIVVGYIAPIPFSGLRWGGGGNPVRDWMPQRMTSSELFAFVRSAANDEFFFADYVPTENGWRNLAHVFPAASFICDITDEARKRIGTCYERRTLAIGTTKQGQPQFATVKFIEKQDWLIARELIAAEIVRRSKAEA